FPSAGPSGREVIAQANPGDTIAFDVVKVDDAVVTVLRAQREPPFHERFKKYIPPPEVKIEVGDTLSVIIWEAASNGLFGNSLAEWSVSPGVASRLLGNATSGIGALSAAGQSLATSSTDVLSQLLGGAPLTGGPGQDLSGLGAQGLAGAVGEGLGAAALALSGLAALPPTLQGTAPAGAAGTLQPRAPAAGGITPQNLQELLQHAVETGRPGTRIPDQQVGTDGAISIPYGGRIEAAGRTPAELQRTIEERLGPKALQPQALVVIRRSIANSVSVSGESVKGMRVPLSLGGDRLLQVIATAGGSSAPVHDI